MGCQFTFKAISYSLPIATCQTVAGVPALQANSASATQELILTQGAPVFISFRVNTNDPATFYNSTAAAPTVNVSGKTWNFSGTLLNGALDSGTISGACNCTN